MDDSQDSKSAVQDVGPVDDDNTVHNPPSKSIVFRFFYHSLVTVLRGLRPYAPQIVPVLVCLLLIPIIILVSIFAGFLVWRNAAVAWNVPIHLQFGDGEPPYATTPLPKLVPWQHYDIHVQLTIPAVESNFALGNFMTSLTLTTPSNETLISVRKPAIAHPRRSSFFLSAPETLTLDVLLLPSFYVPSSDLVAYVQIGRNDDWKTVGGATTRELSVVSASIRGTVVHYGVKGLVTRFPLTASLLSAAAFLTIMTGFVAACTLPSTIRSAYEIVPSPARFRAKREELPLTPVTPETELKSATRKRRRLGGRRSVQTSGVSTSRLEESLRRRTSRSFDRGDDYYS